MRTSKALAVLMVALVAAGAVAAAAPAAPATPSAASAKITPRLASALEDLPPGADAEVIVETTGPSAPAADAAEALGAEIIWTYHIIDAFAARVAVEDVPALAAQPWAERLWDSRPVTTLMDKSAGDIQAPAAWSAGYNGDGVTVAVIDTGIEVTDPAFSGAIVACVATIGGLVAPECDDTDGHGTHVSGTVASRDETYRGIAWGASLAAVRVLHAVGTGTSADIIAGMEWVMDNQDNVNPPIRVATMSIGFLDPGCGDGTGPEAEAADALVASGVSFTIAAGNSGHKDCTVDGASAAFDVITVGAVDDQNTIDPADDTIADFSSGGPTKDGRLKPEIVAPGVEIWSVYLGPTVAALDGTSMATPHVAGTIAVLLQAEPGLTPAQVKDRLTKTTVAPDAAPGLPNNVWGYGLVNVCNALGLTDCTATSDPVAVHVQAVDMDYAHANGKNPHKEHRVTSHVTVVDENGDPAGGVGVSVTTTSPEGNVYELSGTTDSQGVASVSAKQRGGGHGTWESCVTGLTGDYDAASNVETCETLAVS